MRDTTAFAQYQHAHIGGSNQSDPVVYVPEYWAGAFMGGCLVPFQPFLQGSQKRWQVVCKKPLLDVILRTQLHRLDGGRYLVVVRHDDIRVVPALFPQIFQQGDAVTVGQAQVCKHHVVFMHFGKIFPCAVAGGDSLAFETFACQQPAYIVGENGVVLDDYSLGYFH